MRSGVAVVVSRSGMGFRRALIDSRTTKVRCGGVIDGRNRMVVMRQSNLGGELQREIM